MLPVFVLNADNKRRGLTPTESQTSALLEPISFMFTTWDSS